MLYQRVFFYIWTIVQSFHLPLSFSLHPLLLLPFPFFFHFWSSPLFFMLPLHHCRILEYFHSKNIHSHLTQTQLGMFSPDWGQQCWSLCTWWQSLKQLFKSPSDSIKSAGDQKHFYLPRNVGLDRMIHQNPQSKLLNGMHTPVCLVGLQATRSFRETLHSPLLCTTDNMEEQWTVTHDDDGQCSLDGFHAISRWI